MEDKHVLDNPIGKMYTTEEVAQMLNVSRKSVQRMIQSGELLAIGNMRHYRIPEEELKNWKEREMEKARARQKGNISTGK